MKEPKVVHIKEADLTKEEEQLLLGHLLNKWENNTRDNRNRFIEMLAKQMQENMKTDIEGIGESK